MPTQILSHAWNKEHAAWTPFRMGLLAFSGLALLAITQVAFTQSRHFQDAKEARVAASKEKPTIQRQIDQTPWFGRVVITADGKIMSWNRGMTRIVGWTSKEMVGQSAKLIDPGETPSESLTFDRVFSRRPGPWVARGKIRLKAKDGKAVDVTVSVRDLEGEPLHRELNFDNADQL